MKEARAVGCTGLGVRYDVGYSEVELCPVRRANTRLPHDYRKTAYQGMVQVRSKPRTNPARQPTSDNAQERACCRV